MISPAATMDLFSSRSKKEPIGTIAVPIRDHLNSSTVMSLLHTDRGFLGEDTLDQIFIQGSVLTLQRNEAIQKMRGKFLLFIDDDMTWEPQAVGNLIATWHDLKEKFGEAAMVGGLCFRRSKPYQPTLFMREHPDNGAYNYLERWDDNVVEVDATGCAFLLIPVEALEMIAGSRMPPYMFRVNSQTLPQFFRWEGAIGEDLRFCQDAKKAGVRIFVDTRIEIGHVAEVTIGREDFLQSLALRTPEEEAVRLRVNEAMGLPTVTRQEARQALDW